jgi:hypothetical protein
LLSQSGCYCFHKVLGQLITYRDTDKKSNHTWGERQVLPPINQYQTHQLHKLIIKKLILPDWSEEEQGFTGQRRALYKARVLLSDSEAVDGSEIQKLKRDHKPFFHETYS